MSRLFLLPLVLALLWWLYLFYFRIPWQQGRQGFYWIIGLSGGLVLFLSLMIWLTH